MRRVNEASVVRRVGRVNDASVVRREGEWCKSSILMAVEEGQSTLSNYKHQTSSKSDADRINQNQILGKTATNQEQERSERQVLRRNMISHECM